MFFSLCTLLLLLCFYFPGATLSRRSSLPVVNYCPLCYAASLFPLASFLFSFLLYSFSHCLRCYYILCGLHLSSLFSYFLLVTSPFPLIFFALHCSLSSTLILIYFLCSMTTFFSFFWFSFNYFLFCYSSLLPP